MDTAQASEQKKRENNTKAQQKNVYPNLNAKWEFQSLQTLLHKKKNSIDQVSFHCFAFFVCYNLLTSSKFFLVRLG